MVLEFMMVLPTLRKLSPSDAVETLKLLSPPAWRYLPVCGAISTLSAVGVVVINQDLESVETGLMLSALAAVAGFLYVSAGLYRREDLRVRGWPPGGIPAEWPAALARLHRLHLVRMGLFLTGYALLVAAIVSS